MFSKPFSDLFNLTSTISNTSELVIQNIENQSELEAAKDKFNSKMAQITKKNQNDASAMGPTMISEHEKQLRKGLVEKAKQDLERITASG